MKRHVLLSLIVGLSAWIGPRPVEAEDELRSARAESALRSVGREVASTELRAARPGEPFRAPLVVHGDEMTLELEPASVRAPGFQVVVIGEKGARTVLDPGPIRTFQGTIPEIPGSRVTGGLFEDGLKLVIRLQDGAAFNLEPASRPGSYVVSECRADEPGETGCSLDRAPLRKGVDGMKSIAAASTGENCANLGGCVADLVFDTDYAYYQQNGGNVQQIQTFLESVLLEVNEAFQSFSLRHQLTQIVIRSSVASDPYQSATTHGELLQLMQTAWQSSPTPRDLVHLFSGGNFGNYGGAAYLGGVSGYAYNGMYSFSSSPSAFCKRAGIVTHELGHNWGANHGCGIMQVGAGDCNSSWCGASLTEIPTRRDQVDGICLELEAPRNAQVLSQNVPATMVAGRVYGVSVTLKNTGTEAWSPIGSQCGAFRLGSANPYNNTTWGPATRVELPGPVAPGGQVTLDFTVSAPLTPGTYSFQWRMVQECVTWFGDFTPNVAVTVQAAPARDAQVLSQSVPTTMTAGQVYPVSIRLRNVGTLSWSPIGAQCNAFRLGSVNPYDNFTWGASRAELPSTVPFGGEVTISFNVTAPATPGTYSFQRRMVQECVTWFGDLSPNVSVSVVP